MTAMTDLGEFDLHRGLHLFFTVYGLHLFDLCFQKDFKKMVLKRNEYIYSARMH